MVELVKKTRNFLLDQELFSLFQPIVPGRKYKQTSVKDDSTLEKNVLTSVHFLDPICKLEQHLGIGTKKYKQKGPDLGAYK